VNPLNDWRRTSHSQSLDAAELSARRARDLLRGVCDEALVSPPMIETAMLLVSEVVTNAVKHGSGRPVLDIDVQPEVLRVTVTDDAPGVPELQRDNPPLADGGRGLQLVETLAARWGTNRRLPSGKSVWFELDHD
jgi:anti-sigma regulatory factor (Ser/Thr protein kinase)